MIKKGSGTQDVTEYLQQPAHWLVRYGISLIFTAVAIGALLSVYLEVDKIQAFTVRIDTRQFTPVHTLNDGQRRQMVAIQDGDSVVQNTHLYRIASLPIGVDYALLKQAYEENQPDRLLEVLQHHSPPRDCVIIAPFEGNYFYDSLEQSSYLFPFSQQYKGLITLSTMTPEWVNDLDNYSLFLADGHPVEATFSSTKSTDSARSFSLHFSMPRPFTPEEWATKELSLTLKTKESLWSGILEKL